MKTLLHKLAIAVLSIALVAPMVEAQNRTTGNRGGNNQSSSQNAGTNSSNRNPGNNGNQGGNNGNNRPSIGNQNSNKQPSINQGGGNGNVNKPTSSNRPNNNNNNGGTNINNRPNNNNGGGNINNRPNNNNGGGNINNRPNNNNGGGNNNWHFGNSVQPNNRPNNNGGGIINQPGPVNRPSVVRPTVRPNRPIANRWTRPVPPRSWRPAAGAPVLSSILGLAFGTAINLSLDYLLNQGYVVDGYGSNVVYLRDINQFNYFWPDATLYYNNGGLTRSEFIESTSYPNMYRYNSLYNTFVMSYGSPVNYSNSGSAVSATWFSSNEGYITLQYSPQISNSGQMRYFTTVTVGL